MADADLLTFSAFEFRQMKADGVVERDKPPVYETHEGASSEGFGN
jgi:hypothetical protein